uniref:Retrotransposon gag domain-containing protein n=1 Tax=Oryza rufipogon TaxID=4529 RepID=A0A0E0R5R8_ORYRU
MLLRSIGQASHLTDDPPDEKTDATKVKAWKIADDRVMGFIFMSVDVAIRIGFKAHTSAKEMWNYLKQRYTQESGALRFSLLQNLNNLQQQQNQSIEEFYNVFTRLTGQFEQLIVLEFLWGVSLDSVTIICSYCKKVGHTFHDCFHLHPKKLVDYQARRAITSRPHVAASVPGFSDSIAARSSMSVVGTISGAALCAPQLAIVGPSYLSSDWSWPSPYCFRSAFHL